ncbi:MAG: DNA polymerase III subunit delta' [Methylovulum sp.]|uniref:DNA polymerase III subunit delta' n=1 Tax=Methylovulum sp. TaxID=1916980 RepID=UPI0026288185|nr:DNA polymerase III subunit delta' [Methylovulum sp.]MDD2723903.1 DNA polymerase III subunit delta' [Methylovulum sp.]MDD5125232.1 DNA polymerase III subunit delta' [Methylovulum sp.]
MTLLPWQQQNWTHLQNYVVQQRIPQALLITGKKGYGKQQLAKQFANALLCNHPQRDGLACGACASCLLFTAQTHPDFIALQPEEAGKGIAIEQVRTLITRISLKPQYDKYRVVIVNPADAMNTRAANAFLKCLEEPAERTVILLITDKPAKLPATIVSRCQKLAIAAAGINILSAWLREQKPGLSSADLPILLALAQYAPLLALEYAHQDTLKQRNDCFKEWLAIAKQQTHPVVVAENWQALSASQLLFWISSWVMDLIKCVYHASTDSLFNPDLIKPLQALAQGMALKKLYGLYDLLLSSRQRLDTTINKQILFEEILIYWSQLNQSK